MQAPTIGIGQLLHESGKFNIPHHQRDYSWGEDQIDQLFHDVSEAILENQPEYFLGLIVLLPQPNTTPQQYTILDGQQRLVTTSIILSAIRDWFTQHGMTDDASQIQRDFIAKRTLGRTEQEPKIILNQNNNDTFTQYVISTIPTDDIQTHLASLRRYDPNRALLDAIVYCRKKVSDIANNSSTATDALISLAKYLETRVKLVRLHVANEADAYTVFETLNDRGLDLSALDLVKNHLFGIAATNSIVLRDTQARWSQMMTNLSNVPGDDFLKAWWTSRYGRIQTPRLFGQFKSKVTSTENATTLSRDMLTCSERYAVLEVADDPFWTNYSAKARERIRILKLLGSKQTHPILLSAIERFEQREIERLFHLLEVVIVRYQLIGGGRTGLLEIACANAAHEIFESSCQNATATHNLFRPLLPSDDDFKAAFKLKQEKNSQKARYLLSCLENHSRQAQSQAEVQPATTLTLEHILPKAPDSSWAPVLSADTALADDCTLRLGNMCLLSDVNRALGSRSFTDKKSVYGASSLLLTRELGQETEWTRRTIEDRQTRLATLATAYWRFQ